MTTIMMTTPTMIPIVQAEIYYELELLIVIVRYP
jgi:hypothetical protein